MIVLIFSLSPTKTGNADPEFLHKYDNLAVKMLYKHQQKEHLCLLNELQQHSFICLQLVCGV